MIELEENIIKLQQKLKKNVKRLNNGGCIHFAYFFSKKLKELNVNHKIVFINEIPISISYNDFYPTVHVLIHIPEIGYIDGHDFFTRLEDVFIEYSEEEYYKHVKLSNKKLNTFRKVKGWNCMYDTKHNKTIEKSINKLFKNGSKRRIIS